MPVHYHLGRFPPDQHLDWSKLIPLLGPTAAVVARYDGMLAAVSNPDALLSPLTTPGGRCRGLHLRTIGFLD